MQIIAGIVLISIVSVASAQSIYQDCIDGVNNFRSSLNLPALSDNGNENCVDSQAQQDQLQNTPHYAFGQCDDFGQCECPNYPNSSDSTSNFNTCLQQMIAEGPGGGHYDILTNRDYTKVACGIYVGHGVQTITIDFFY